MSETSSRWTKLSCNEGFNSFMGLLYIFLLHHLSHILDHVSGVVTCGRHMFRDIFFFLQYHHCELLLKRHSTVLHQQLVSVIVLRLATDTSTWSIRTVITKLPIELLIWLHPISSFSRISQEVVRVAVSDFQTWATHARIHSLIYTIDLLPT